MTPLVDLLGKSGRAAYPFLRGAAAGKESANSILDRLRAAGFSISRSTGLSIINALRNPYDPAAYIRLNGLNAPLPSEAYMVSPTRQPKRFGYVVGTNSDNPLIPESVFVSSDVELSAIQIYSLAGEAFSYEESAGQRPKDLADVSFTIDDAWWNPGALTSERGVGETAAEEGPGGETIGPQTGGPFGFGRF